MRIDKFLKVSRILKRRTVAKDASACGRVKVNDREVKPSYQVKVGDIVEVLFASQPVKFKIEQIKETVRKEEVENLYTILND